MHQPINERVTNLVATRQETTQAQAASASVVLNNNNNNNNNLALAPLIKQEGQLVEEGQPRAQEAGLGLELAELGLNIETSEPPGLERGEVGPKLEIADGAPLVCRTCNRVSRRWKALRRP